MFLTYCMYLRVCVCVREFAVNEMINYRLKWILKRLPIT